MVPPVRRSVNDGKQAENVVLLLHVLRIVQAKRVPQDWHRIYELPYIDSFHLSTRHFGRIGVQIAPYPPGCSCANV